MTTSETFEMFDPTMDIDAAVQEDLELAALFCLNDPELEDVYSQMLAEKVDVAAPFGQLQELPPVEQQDFSNDRNNNTDSLYCGYPSQQPVRPLGAYRSEKKTFHASTTRAERKPRRNATATPPKQNNRGQPKAVPFYRKTSSVEDTPSPYKPVARQTQQHVEKRDDNNIRTMSQLGFPEGCRLDLVDRDYSPVGRQRVQQVRGQYLPSHPHRQVQRASAPSASATSTKRKFETVASTRTEAPKISNTTTPSPVVDDADGYKSFEEVSKQVIDYYQREVHPYVDRKAKRQFREKGHLSQAFLTDMLFESDGTNEPQESGGNKKRRVSTTRQCYDYNPFGLDLQEPLPAL